MLANAGNGGRHDACLNISDELRELRVWLGNGWWWFVCRWVGSHDGQTVRDGYLTTWRQRNPPQQACCPLQDRGEHQPYEQIERRP